MSLPEQLSINIRPDSGVYATFRRIAYRPWSAIAEFIDNSTQNYFEYKQDIGKANRARPALEIDVVHDTGAKTLAIIDNANGMNWSELERAIQLNRPPVDTSGRSEFGMGLKMAACWFGGRWRIVTKRLGDDIEYEALVDVRRLEVDKPDAIVVTPRMGLDRSEHYTRIEIEDLHRTFRGGALSSIQENVASMYRRDIDSGDITIRWNGEPFEWEKDPVCQWRRDIRPWGVDGQRKCPPKWSAKMSLELLAMVSGHSVLTVGRFIGGLSACMYFFAVSRWMASSRATLRIDRPLRFAFCTAFHLAV